MKIAFITLCILCSGCSNYIRPTGFSNDEYSWSCDSNRTQILINFEDGFKNDHVRIYNNDSLMYGKIISTKNSSGSAGSFLVSPLPNKLFVKINDSHIKEILFDKNYCFMFISKHFGFITAKMSKNIKGPRV